MRGTNPTFFEFKKRNTDVIEYLISNSGGRGGIGMYGDILWHMAKPPKFYDERLKMLK